MNRMKQHFSDFGRASECNYCRHYCAKCYFQFVKEFIEPMEKANGTLPEDGFPNGMWWDRIMEFPGVKGHLVSELENLPLSEFMQLQHWAGQLCIGFAMVKDGGLQAGILRRWLATCPDNIQFVDVVIFYLLPPIMGDETLRQAWLSKAVNIAVAQRDISLVESLVWRLREDLEKYPDLLKLATEFQKTSPSISKAMDARIQTHG